jgi:hypothetical protein
MLQKQQIQKSKIQIIESLFSQVKSDTCEHDWRIIFTDSNQTEISRCSLCQARKIEEIE